MKRLFPALLALLGLAPAGLAADTAMSGAEVRGLARLVVPADRNPAGWAADVSAALDSNAIARSRSNVCAVMAVIEQESTFTANPEVKGLGAMAERQIKEKLASLPMIPDAAAEGVGLFLALKPTPEKSYRSMIRAARSERDLDLVYRNLVFYLFRQFATTRLLNTPAVAHRIDSENPVATLGSMQVSAGFAIAEVEAAKGHRLGLSAMWKLRDELYTRKGGIAYGTRMLLGYRAGYGSRLYVFADYNAGRYASRNAAFQHMVATLSGRTLALDGDLLIYEGANAAKAASETETALRRLDTGLSEDDIRSDLLTGKSYAFRDSETYHRVAKAFSEKTGKPAPYAMLPQIRLKSPKIRHGMTTADFARAVMRRYERCMTVK